MIGTIISSFIVILTIFNIWSKLLNIKLDYKKIRTWIYILFSTFILMLNFFNVNNFFKIITSTLLCIIICKLLFSIKLRNSILGPIITQIMYLISESVLASILFLIFNKEAEELVNNYVGSFITNTIESFMVMTLFKTNIFNKIYLSLNQKLTKIDDSISLVLCISIIYIYSIFAFNIYYDINPGISILISAVISLMSFVLIYFFIKAKDDFYKINDKYNSSLASLKELETALMNHRIDNHENKNQLMTIRNMTTNKKVVKFIDSILDNKLKDNNNILHETSVIPSGGLRGLIYSKLLVMSNKNIEYELDISNTVRVVDILDYGDETMLDVCKIVGIFLDNAIEEVETIDDKYIAIEMYKDEEIFTISIMNTYNSSIDKTNIYKVGVSTKGGNHGYGLPLVKKLVNSNCKLETKTEITDNEFTQILYVHK